MNKILPQNCIDNITKYIEAGLFKHSDAGADEFCANITLVKRSTAPGAVKQTKADKHILKQTNTKQNDSNALYRATVDFRSINFCTKSPKTVALPSIQTIENTFSQAYVSTLDITNMFPSIKLTPSSYKYFNFYFGDKILTHSRLPQG